jgi:hypothetical protein
MTISIEGTVSDDWIRGRGGLANLGDVDGCAVSYNLRQGGMDVSSRTGTNRFCELRSRSRRVSFV